MMNVAQLQQLRYLEMLQTPQGSADNVLIVYKECNCLATWISLRSSEITICCMEGFHGRL